MLDDLKMIHGRDAEDALGVTEKQWQQLAYEFSLPDDFRPEHISNIIYAGMGGSALSAQLAKTWLDVAAPFEIVRDYALPAYADGRSLCIITSYSGNTEEALSVLKAARAKGCVIVIITAGGKLADLAREYKYPLLTLPTGYQPRYTAWYTLKAILITFERCGLVAGKLAELVAQADWFHGQLDGWRADVPVKQNLAKQIALELMGKTVIIYAGPQLFPAALRWKTSLNENAKQLAWCGQLPEFNHNEFMSWTKQPVQKPFAVVELRSNLEHERVQRRFEVSERLLSGMRPAPHVIAPVGETTLQQLLYAVGLGDMVSLYTALLSGLNPSSLELVDTLKQELGRYEV